MLILSTICLFVSVPGNNHWNSNKYLYKKGEERCFRYKGAVDNQAVFVEDITFGKGFDDLCVDSLVDDGFLFDENCILVELNYLLKDVPFGYSVLDALLHADKKVNFDIIDSYMFMFDEEKTEENKELIANAFNIIKKYVYDFFGVDKTFKKSIPSSIRYSFEV